MIFKAVMVQSELESTLVVHNMDLPTPPTPPTAPASPPLYPAQVTDANGMTHTILRRGGICPPAPERPDRFRIIQKKD